MNALCYLSFVKLSFVMHPSRAELGHILFVHSFCLSLFDSVTRGGIFVKLTDEISGPELNFFVGGT